MTKNKDWMERNHAALHEQVNQTWHYIQGTPASEKLADWGYMPDTPLYTWIVSTFGLAVNNLNQAYNAWTDAALRTRVATTALADAETALRPLYRELYRMFKSNVIITNADLQSMGMPSRNAAGNAPTPPPATVPEATVTLPSRGVVVINYRDKDSDKRAKPAGVHGVECAWALLDAPPQSNAQLLHSYFDTRSPIKLTFDVADCGRILYFSLRWENTTGEKGDWSPVYDTVIP